MSRARARKQEEKQEFFESNPEAVEHDTQISVEKDGIHLLVASDGEGPLPLFNDVEESTGKVTYLDDAETEEGRFFAFESEGGDGGEDAYISLSKDGIGVLGEDEQAFNENNNNAPRESRAMDEGEGIVFITDGGFGGHEGCFQVQGGEDEFGLSGVNIEFEVLNNKGGLITLVMFDTGKVKPNPEQQQEIGPPEQSFIQTEIEIAAGEKGRVEDIGFFLPEGELYDGFQVFVDGQVQVALVGVDYSTEGEPGGGVVIC